MVLKRTDPSGVAIRNMIPPGTAGVSNASVIAQKTVYAPFATAGSTANAGLLSWINPENGTIVVTDVQVYFSTTGTGTVDIGVSADGTGSNDDIVNGGTMSALAYTLRAYRGRTGTQGAGVTGIQDAWVIGPGGTGTNNSIVAKTAETASTSVGGLIITYYGPLP